MTYGEYWYLKKSSTVLKDGEVFYECNVGDVPKKIGRVLDSSGTSEAGRYYTNKLVEYYASGYSSFPVVSRGRVIAFDIKKILIKEVIKRIKITGVNDGQMCK